MQQLSLQDLGLSEEDFELLIQGLEHLPNKDLAGDLMTGILEGLFMDKNDPGAREKLIQKRELETRRAEALKNKMKEDIKVLQGKMILLKRFLQERDALAHVEKAKDIISG